MIPFLKMHGAGNDFVVIDNRKTNKLALNYQKIADRNFGIGCDQIIILENSHKADIFMGIINADGSEVSSCGNASRCIGWLVANELKKQTATIETLAGVILAEIKEKDQVCIDMGDPILHWQEIPLSQEVDINNLPITLGQLSSPVAVSMGNPHMIFFVPDVNTIDLAIIGKELEYHPLFPKRTNVEIAQIINKNTIKLRVWERGAGLTLACGTGACATLVAAHLRGLTGRKASVELPGGVLQIEWQESDGHVMMTGPVATSFTGNLNPEYYSL